MVIKPVFAVCSLHYDPHCVWSLLDLVQSNFFVGHCQINTTLLPNARNLAIRKVLENNPDFTHLIFIDDDMTDFTAEHAQALIEADKDIISALVTMRRPPYTIPTTLINHEMFTPQTVIEHMKKESVLEAHTVGMAFTCIKRHVIDKLAEGTPTGPIWFTMDREPRESLQTEMIDLFDDLRKKFLDNAISFGEVLNQAISFGMSAHICTSILGEDICFCNRATKFGFKSWVHCGVIVSHVGTKPFNVRDTIKFHMDQEVNRLYNTSKGDTINEEGIITESRSIVPA